MPAVKRNSGFNYVLYYVPMIAYCGRIVHFVRNRSCSVWISIRYEIIETLWRNGTKKVYFNIVVV